MRRWLLGLTVEMLVVVGLSLAAAAAWNTSTYRGVPPFRRLPVAKSPFSEAEREKLHIDLADVKKHWDRIRQEQPDSLLIDARSRPEYDQGHIPYSIHVSSATFDDPKTGWKMIEPFVKNVAVIIVYCSNEGCQNSWGVARRLQDRGVDHIRVFAGGWLEWKQANYPIEKTETKAKTDKG